MKKYILLLILLGANQFLTAQRGETPFEKFNRLYLDGVYHYVTAEYERSEGELTQCLRMADTVGSVYYYLALNRLAQGQNEMARRYLDSACRVQSGLAEAFRRNFRAEARRLRKQATPQVSATSPSGQKVEVSTSRLPDREQFLQNAAKIPPGKRWETGKKLVERFPFDAKLILITARAGTETGHWQEAARLLVNGIDFASVDPKLYRQYLTLLVRIYEHTGERAKAGHYRKLLEKQ